MKSLHTHLKSLSKECFKLFKTPKLIFDHFLFSTQRNQLLILDRFYWNDKTSGHHLFLLDVKRKELKELHVPRVTDSDMGFKMVGSCDGLVCVAHYSLDPTSTLFLWNPATGQIKQILEPQNALLPYKVSPNCLIGFYFNHSDNDYQVVRLHSFEDTNNACCWGDSLSNTHAVQVEIYSLQTGLWREIKYSDQHVTVNGVLFWTENSVTVKGTLFWVAMETIGLFSRLERPVGIRKNEVLMATDKQIHSVGGVIALLPEDDLGAEFSYNLFNYEESFVPLHSGNMNVVEANPIEREGFLLYDMLASNVNKLSIEDKNM
ncbi:F-box associated interaction domain [Sesbania bispinosa]|nr:F-box associated interaction domain [Sesbania bispinosa]